MSFWLLAATVLALTVAAIAWGALAASRARPAADAAARLYRQRLDELDEDVRAGLLDADAAAGIAAELGRTALAEREARPPATGGRTQRLVAVVLAALLVPAIALPVYLALGRPDLATGEPAARTALAHASIEELTAQLVARLEVAPDDAEARQWLARVHMAAGEYGKAADEFARLHAQLGDTAPLLLQWADALAMREGGRLAGRPAELVARALALEPDNVTALWLSALAAEEAGDRAGALAHLERARAASEAAHLPIEDLDRAIAALSGGPAAPVPTNGAEAGSGPRIEVEVAVGEALAGRIGPDAVLFVLARATGPDAPPAPLAVKRLAAAELPTTVTLDDSLAMAPGMGLGSAKEVTIVARVSQHGDALPQPGDLEGTAGPLPVAGTTGPVRVTLTRVVE